MTRSPDHPIPHEPIPRRPGTAARVLLFLAVLFGYALTLSIAFPPGAPDRLPVLVLSILLALATAQRWARGARLFAFLFPCAGLIARVAGGADPAAWPTLLFAGFATGWAFRFIYDFDTRPDPSGPDDAVRALLALWAVSTLFAVVEARTLWALGHGLLGRTVNGDGLPESTAIRESLLSFGALASGAGFFLVLRRSGQAIRRRTLEAAFAGATLCAAAAILQRLAVLPPERNPFWKTTERLSGGAVDPNSLGLVSAMALVIVAVGAFGSGNRLRLPSALAAAILGLGLILSGSRSGLLVVVVSLILLPALRARARSLRAIGLSAAAAGALLVTLWLLSGSRGSLGGRLVDSFDPSQPVASRVSARPMLWGAAWRLFRENPIEGGGLGVYAWRLPDLLRAQGVHLKLRDNPGSAYFQALAETGILGLALTLVFAAALVRDAARRLARGAEESDGGLETASALASLSFLAALAVGSHWLAGETSLFFFLAAAVGVLPAPEKRAVSPRAWLAAAVALYAVAASVAMLSTARPEEAFRYGPRIGFYPPEPGRDGPFQWTRQNFALWLSPGQRVKLGLGHFSPIGRPLEVRALEGERILYRRSLAPGEAVVLHLSGAASRPAAVRFEASRSFVPRNHGIPGGDVRRLGLQSVDFDR
jgi:O-antigen ligase